MCLRFRQEIGNSNDWIKNVWFTDEAHFYLNGIVNLRTAEYGARRLQTKLMNVLFIVINAQRCVL